MEDPPEGGRAHRSVAGHKAGFEGIEQQPVDGDARSNQRGEDPRRLVDHHREAHREGGPEPVEPPGAERHSGDPGVIEDGSLYLRIIAFAQIGQTFEIVLEGALAGAGYTFWPMLVGTVLTALRVPLAAWWSQTFGLFGIWLALSLTAISRGIANTVFWLCGSWKKTVV